MTVIKPKQRGHCRHSACGRACRLLRSLETPDGARHRRVAGLSASSLALVAPPFPTPSERSLAPEFGSGKGVVGDCSVFGCLCERETQTGASRWSPLGDCQKRRVPWRTCPR